MSFRALTLYVVRHGECEHNAAGWVAGHNDSPLTANGRDHARANGRILAEVADPASLDFFASPLHRACTTMELLRETAGLPATGYRADRRLMEGDVGDHSFLPAREMLRHADESGDAWNYVHPNGESVAQVHARVGQFLHTIRRDSVLVSHALTGAMIRALPEPFAGRGVALPHAQCRSAAPVHGDGSRVRPLSTGPCRTTPSATCSA